MGEVHRYRIGYISINQLTIMKKLFQFLIAVFVIGMLAIGGKMVLDQYPDLLDAVLPNSSKEPENSVALSEKVLSGPYDVVRVVDGDTAIIAINGEDTRVRFIGVDTPESVNPDESKNTPEGKEASDFTKELLTGKTVCLEYDVQLTDDYGRTLAYIYLDDGATMVQTLLLEKGLATTMTVQPNSKYASLFYDTMVTARENKVGFWATGFFAE